MRYWVFRDGQVLGPMDMEKVLELEGFSRSMLVCPASSGAEGPGSWRRASEFPDIAQALQVREAAQPPLPPVSSLAPSLNPLPGGEGRAREGEGSEADEILTTTSRKLFHHISELMGELERAREDRTLAQSLNRQLILTRDELQAAQQKLSAIEGKAALVPGYQEREKQYQEETQRLRGLREEEERSLRDLKIEVEKMRRGEQEVKAHLRMQKELNDSLTRQLQEKEAALMKSLGVIRKLEGELDQLLPHEVHSPEQPPQTAPPPEQKSPGTLSGFLRKLRPPS